MRKEMVMIGRPLFALLILFLVWGCSGGQQESGQKQVVRPSNVPNNAAWVGGADGGAYILVTKPDDVPPDIYVAKVYHENGEIWYGGKLALRPEGSNPFDISDAKLLSGWDGDTIYLSDGRRLNALDSVN